MIKKLVFVAVAVVAGLFSVEHNQTSAATPGTAVEKGPAPSCSKQVPLEFENRTGA